jgi:hypothetical protein
MDFNDSCCDIVAKNNPDSLEFAYLINIRGKRVSATKYGDLVKPLSFKAGMGGANARELVFVGGEELGGMELNFIVGVYDQVGDWAPNRGAHDHPFDECLLFFGYDDKDMSYLGSDMSLCVGREYEKHYFSVPTVVAAPKGVPHCPLLTEKVYKPFGHFHLALAASYSGGRVTQEGTTDGDKYTHFFHEMKVREGPGGAAAVQIMEMSGDQLEGFGLNFRMSLHNATGEWYPGKGSQISPYDKCLVFFGHNTDNLSYLGAELTIAIGGEKEEHTFNVPTVVALPQGTPHFPITCNKLERPYTVMEIGLAAKYEVAQV